MITESAQEGLALQNENGSFPKGMNGPWKDEDTYVRTTAHWTLLQYKAFEITKDRKHETSAKKACDYLLEKGNRPYGYSFYCREGRKKDRCNGLIGQAWALEALLQMSIKTGEEKYLDCVRELLICSSYDKKNHIWNNVEIDGKLFSCGTLNQQIWFNVMVLIGSKVLKDKNLEDKAVDFFKHIFNIIEFLDDGLIKHEIGINNMSVKRLIKNILKLSVNTDMEKIKIRSFGYISFILFGFAIAYNNCGQYTFWENNELKSLIRNAYFYVKNRKPYGCGSDGSDYIWGYNPVGIEMAYTIQALNDYLQLNESEEEIKYWLNLQIKNHYDFNTKYLSKNTVDPAILSARLYEAAYLDNYVLEIVSF